MLDNNPVLARKWSNWNSQRFVIEIHNDRVIINSLISKQIVISQYRRILLGNKKKQHTSKNMDEFQKPAMCKNSNTEK